MPAPEPRSQTRLRNATDDGAFGLAVSAWCDGIAVVTGRPFVAPMAGPVRQLVDAINRHRGSAEPVAWARETATAFVAATPGGTYDVFRFVSWLNSGRPTRGRPEGETPGLTRAERLAKERDEDAARRRRIKEAKSSEPLRPFAEVMAEARAKLGGGDQ